MSDKKMKKSLSHARLDDAKKKKFFDKFYFEFKYFFLELKIAILSE